MNVKFLDEDYAYLSKQELSLGKDFARRCENIGRVEERSIKRRTGKDAFAFDINYGTDKKDISFNEETFATARFIFKPNLMDDAYEEAVRFYENLCRKLSNSLYAKESKIPQEDNIREKRFIMEFVGMEYAIDIWIPATKKEFKKRSQVSALLHRLGDEEQWT